MWLLFSVFLFSRFQEGLFYRNEIMVLIFLQHTGLLETIYTQYQTGNNSYISLHVCLLLSFRSDPHTLVELVNFFSLGKVQPFSIDISTNCLLLMVGHSSPSSHAEHHG